MKPALHQDPDFGDYRRRTHRPIDNRALDACARFVADVLVVESERESIVPHVLVANYIAAFANAHSLTYRVLEAPTTALDIEPDGWRLSRLPGH